MEHPDNVKDDRALLRPDEKDASLQATDKGYFRSSDSVFHNVITAFPLRSCTACARLCQMPARLSRAVFIAFAIALLLSSSLAIMLSKTAQGISLTSAIGFGSTAAHMRYSKPKDIRIVAAVFYGRAPFVDVLDCYLQRNLAVNGGFLDEVLFLNNTEKRADIDFLNELLPRVPQYRVQQTKGYGRSWSGLTEPNTIYVKIDDDMVWFDDDAIPSLVSTLIRHPEAYDVSANLINSPLTARLHFHAQAVHAFLPETTKPSAADLAQTVDADWRTSHVPPHDGANVAQTYDLTNHKTDRPWSGWPIGTPDGPSHAHQRWRLLSSDNGTTTASSQLLKTPIAHTTYDDPWGPAWSSWAIAAQQHYSLLKNIEDDTLSLYHFGNAKEGVWNMQYVRFNINFLAIWGHDVARRLPTDDDEGELAVVYPRESGRPLLIDTRALASHFNFESQAELKQGTDLLERYRRYANEFVCAADNRKEPRAFS